MCTVDLVFNVPGEALWQECTKGRDGLHELARRAMESEHASTISSRERYRVMSEQTQLTEPPPVAVAVIGLGDMGSALARAFLANRHRVTVWNRTAAKATPLVQAGAQQAKSVEAAVAAGDVIVVCVLDYAISESLLPPQLSPRSCAAKHLCSLRVEPPGWRGKPKHGRKTTTYRTWMGRS